MEVLIYIGLAVLGAAFGSFAGATMWRLRASQLKEDKAVGESVDKKEYKRLKPLMEQSFWKGRSICLDTGKSLPWYDLIPIVSWIALKGKSRFSGKPIGVFELAIELLVAAFFVVSFAVWPYDLGSVQAISLFVLWLISGVGLAILFAYDIRWFLLPDKIVYPLIAIGALMAVIRIVGSPEVLNTALDTLYAVLMLGGLYFVLHTVSKGRWVGFGDVKLGVFLGLVLGSWPLALLCLFLANFIGCLYVTPLLWAKKLKRTSRVPFGPFLILGFIVTMLFGQRFIDWYIAFTFSGLMQ